MSIYWCLNCETEHNGVCPWDVVKQLREEKTKYQEAWKGAQKKDQVIRCAFCGHAYPPGTPTHQADLLTEHIAVCEAHPVGKKLRKVTLERDEAQANYQWMVNHVADTKLAGYRELGEKIANAEEKIDQLKQEKTTEVTRLCQIVRAMLPDGLTLGYYSSDNSNFLDWQLCDSDGDPVDDDVVKAEIEKLNKEIKRLNNKLNKDSQNFQIECLKAEVKMLREREAACHNMLLFSSQTESH
jgi:hypothetical protein